MKQKNLIIVSSLILALPQVHAFGRIVSGGSSGSSNGPFSTPGSSSSASSASTSSSAPSSSSSSSAASSVPSSGNGAQIVNKILTIAGNSSCAAYSWSGRGKAPKGFVKGMALTYARSLCRLDDPNTNRRTPASLMSRAQSGSTSKDALAFYKARFDVLGMITSRASPETLRSLYTLGIGLGMRESSGKYCEGYDVDAGRNRPSNEAEAGLFQASYNSIAASAELRKIYDEYSADRSRCMLSTFKEGVSCTARSIIGTGAGASYQKLAKECPAFATEYSMALLRVLRAHFGPINRREAEVTSSCNSMLMQVQQAVDAGGSAACSAID